MVLSFSVARNCPTRILEALNGSKVGAQEAATSQEVWCKAGGHQKNAPVVIKRHQDLGYPDEDIAWSRVVSWKNPGGIPVFKRMWGAHLPGSGGGKAPAWWAECRDAPSLLHGISERWRARRWLGAAVHGSLGVKSFRLFHGSRMENSRENLKETMGCII